MEAVKRSNCLKNLFTKRKIQDDLDPVWVCYLTAFCYFFAAFSSLYIIAKGIFYSTLALILDSIPFKELAMFFSVSSNYLWSMRARARFLISGRTISANFIAYAVFWAAFSYSISWLILALHNRVRSGAYVEGFGIWLIGETELSAYFCSFFFFIRSSTVTAGSPRITYS